MKYYLWRFKCLLTDHLWEEKPVTHLFLALLGQWHPDAKLGDSYLLCKRCYKMKLQKRKTT